MFDRYNIVREDDIREAMDEVQGHLGQQAGKVVRL